MHLSRHFTLGEMTRSQTALRHGIVNSPNDDAIENLRRLALTVLEPIRSLLAVPVHVDSGFRSRTLNAAVGGASKSAHIEGRAADIVPVGIPIREAFDAIRRSGIAYDQLILECDAWIHVSVPALADVGRRQDLVATGRPGAWRYAAAPPLEKHA